MPIRFSCTSKIRRKVNIWGGISYGGPSQFAVYIRFSTIIYMIIQRLKVNNFARYLLTT